MSTRRLGVAVAVLGGYLYAVGGSDGTSPLNTGKLFIAYYLHSTTQQDNCLVGKVSVTFEACFRFLNTFSYYVDS